MTSTHTAVPRTFTPSPVALAGRAFILLSLIAEAAWVYLLHRLLRRGWLRREEGWLEDRFGRFAARFVRVATRFRGGLIKLGQVASLRVDVIPDAMTDELVKLQDSVPLQTGVETLVEKVGRFSTMRFGVTVCEPQVK